MGFVLGVAGKGMLYPRESESRDMKNLDGMWNFRADSSPSRKQGFDQNWFKSPLSQTGPVIPMPVPSSFNDITQDKALRDYVGWVWYDREFFVSSDWLKHRVVLRFDSAHYYSIVWVNSQEVMRHDGGHLPFEEEINSYLTFGGSNRVTIAVNNTLTPHTLPPGSITYKTDRSRYPAGYFVQNVQMDFFNYGGIHRHVRLYTTPNTYVDDVTITTDIAAGKGVVNYKVESGGSPGVTSVNVDVVDKAGNVVGSSDRMSGVITVTNPNLWYPYTMTSGTPAYLYLFKVRLRVSLVSATGTDVYRLPFGIRTVHVTDSQILVNSKPFYCQGVAKHEDSDVKEKAWDYALIAKDFNLLKWMGVNCFRTSHYPYAEEIMDQADQQGIMVIDESPGVGIDENENFSNISLTHHLDVMTELVQRDKNRPSVFMWSVANEPRTDKAISEAYFKSVIGHTRSLDATRPVTFVSNQRHSNDKALQFVDVICYNRYYGWYNDIGHTEVIQLQLGTDLDATRVKYRKPIIITEYGADTIPGLHRDPSFVFTEEYQVEFLEEYHKLFDAKIGKYLVGEMVWNFADFMTVQGVRRVVGNKKGLLTRQRQPKHAAFTLRSRYLTMMNKTSPTSSSPLVPIVG
ncbi:beta-glucuronidase-like [Haliotis rubra]|uniref:beta-glucuronidase-like n=1 Tax=Haliotis rubra TaxID=36100 RepID=UPI001EE57F05|nr:beta-glucuronidase-like [Haliotis rubra]